MLSDEDKARLRPAETLEPTPLPLQMVSSDEFPPDPQSEPQRRVAAALAETAERESRRQGLSRRRFFQSAAGMAAGFAAMNAVYGPLFAVDPAEAATPELADALAEQNAGQFVMDMHTHFLRDDTQLTGFARMRESIGKLGWNEQLSGRQSLEDLKFENYIKEVFLDSDTKVALISSSPSDDPEDWFLTNEQMAAARAKVNAEAGSKRLYAHAIFTPAQPGWLDALDAALALEPDSMKGYTVGDNTNKATSRWPWRMDDEAVAYRGYEKMVAAGIRNVCVHKGLFNLETSRRFPELLPYADVSDVGQAAKDWPQLNFIVYHSGYRHVGGDPAAALAAFEESGRIDWTTDLAEIPEKYGVDNVYGDVGQLFAMTLVSQPALCAALMGTLIRGLGADHVCWGSDAVWTGSPQWQIEGLRRLEIPEAMQREHGFAPLGAADGPVKTAILGGNNARLYGHDVEPRGDWRQDRLQERKRAYLERGREPSNLRYGWVAG